LSVVPQDTLLHVFVQFGLVALIGFLIGLEREMRSAESVTLGIRDFVLFALLGGLSAFLADRYDNTWLILAGFAGVLALTLSSYWAERTHGPGVTTEIAAAVTFMLGVLVLSGMTELAIALAIGTVAVLFPKAAIKRFRSHVQAQDMRAVLLFLTITFIVLPVLPNLSLDHYASVPVGTVTAIDPRSGRVGIEVVPEGQVSTDQTLEVLQEGMQFLGHVNVTQVAPGSAAGVWEGADISQLQTGMSVRRPLGIGFVQVMLAAINPYRIWLIVVLVSLVSFVGYVLIKLIGSGAGIGLTGLVGGLVSSTVTTLSFARRSREAPEGNRLFAVAVLLAASIMFPRLIVEIAVFDQMLMRSIAVPLGVMGVTGLLLAVFFFRRSQVSSATHPELRFENPFSLKAAVTFALVFAAILMVTRLATSYLGNAWLPVVAIVSGLTDADAIAFSLSNLHRADLVSTDWASFNLVLGALSNTFMKLFLVLTLGHRELFRHLLVAFLIIGAAGILTMVLHYDLSQALQFQGGVAAVPAMVE
jgi:uncharacterized membrane protein (DUF4010 family)